MTALAATDKAAGLREKILLEATRLFATHGYNATSIREVCEAAGCTKPSLYYYFAGKDDLYVKAISLEVESLNDMVQRTVTSPGPVRKRLMESLQFFVQHAQENPHAMALLHRAEMEQEQGRPEVDVAGARKLHLRLIGQLVEQGIERGEVRDDVNPRDCAVALAGTVSFQFQLCFLCGEPWPEGQLERTIALLFDGIATK
jgi:AcrR family transcriptional regulator